VTNRRELLGTAIAAAGVLGLRAGTAWAAPADDPMLGVQLWSVKDLMQTDRDGTLRALAGIGFRRVEAAGWLGRSPEEFRRAVDAAGLRCDSAHFGMDTLMADMQGAVGQVRDAGCEYLICASPFVPRPLAPNLDWTEAVIQAMTLDAWQRTAALLNRAGAVAAAAGVKVGYHNHVAEFALYEGQRGYDVLLNNTDPAIVKLELDLAWAAAGGEDPLLMIGTHRARICRLHLKDVRTRPRPLEISTDFVTVAPGSGVLDWRAILRAARAAGIPGAYIEVESPYLKSPLEDLAAGRAYLVSLAA
jgi:sugar phosphate isomerase/epimerase